MTGKSVRLAASDVPMWGRISESSRRCSQGGNEELEFCSSFRGRGDCFLRSIFLNAFFLISAF